MKLKTKFQIPKIKIQTCKPICHYKFFLADKFWKTCLNRKEKQFTNLETLINKKLINKS